MFELPSHGVRRGGVCSLLTVVLGWLHLLEGGRIALFL